MSKKVIFVNDGVESVIDLDDVKKCEEFRIDVNKECRISKKKSKRIQNKIIAITPLLCTIGYLCFGFIGNMWHPTWLLFLLIPIVPIVFSVFETKGKGLWILVTILFCTIGYLCVGFILSIWHPTWLVFFLIPIVSILLGDYHN